MRKKAQMAQSEPLDSSQRAVSLCTGPSPRAKLETEREEKAFPAFFWAEGDKNARAIAPRRTTDGEPSSWRTS